MNDNNFIEKKSSSITSEEIKIFDANTISNMNKVKWAYKNKKYKSIYSEIQQFARYENLADGTPIDIIKFLLKSYTDGIVLDHIDNGIINSIMGLLSTIDLKLESKGDNEEFICKLEAMVDYLNE